MCNRISEAEDQHSRAISDLKRNEEDRLTKSLEESLAKEKVTMVDNLRTCTLYSHI